MINEMSVKFVSLVKQRYILCTNHCKSWKNKRIMSCRPCSSFVHLFNKRLTLGLCIIPIRRYSQFPTINSLNLGLSQGLLYHRTCKRDFLCRWPSLNSYLKQREIFNTVPVSWMQNSLKNFPLF